MTTTTETTQPDLVEQAKAVAATKGASAPDESSPLLDRIRSSMDSKNQPAAEAEPKVDTKVDTEPEPESEAEQEPTDTRSALEKAAAGDVDTDDGGDDDMPQVDAKAGAAFKKLKSQIKEQRAELAKLKAEYGTKDHQFSQISSTLAEALGIKDVTPEAVEARARELSIKAAVVDLESTPQYQDAVEAPKKILLANLKRVAEVYEIDQDQLQQAIMEKDHRKQNELIDDITGDMHARDQRAIYQAVEDMALIEAKQTELRAQANQAMGQINEERQRTSQAMAAQNAREIDHHTRAYAEKLKMKMPAMAEHIEGQVELVVQELQKGTSTEVQAYAALAGLMLPNLEREISNRDKQIVELNKTIESYRGVTPGAKPGESRTTTTEPITDKSESFMDRIAKQLRNG